MERDLFYYGANTLRESGDSHYVNDERVVRFEGIIQISLNIFEASRNESHNGGELCGSTDDSLGHAQAFVESVGGAESSHKNSIRVDGNLSKPRENVVTRENRAAIKAVNDFIKAEDRNLGISVTSFSSVYLAVVRPLEGGLAAI